MSIKKRKCLSTGSDVYVYVFLFGNHRTTVLYTVKLDRIFFLSFRQLFRFIPIQRTPSQSTKQNSASIQRTNTHSQQFSLYLHLFCFEHNELFCLESVAFAMLFDSNSQPIFSNDGICSFLTIF